ncbi:MAG: hypothetical protein LBB92_02945 [Endomicrobium sp.]|nr:hypothetical protein [Endomicrobium sp.]
MQGSKEGITKLRIEAAKLGSDAIIIVGSARVESSTTYSYLINHAGNVTQEKGWKALAVKYKQNKS